MSEDFFNYRMLYCSTSSHYRTAFLHVVTCGRLRTRFHGGHRDYILVYRDRVGSATGANPIAHSLPRSPCEILTSRRVSPSGDSGSGVLSADRYARYMRGQQPNNSPISCVARAASGPPTINHMAINQSPSRYSSHTHTYEYRNHTGTGRHTACCLTTSIAIELHHPIQHHISFDPPANELNVAGASVDLVETHAPGGAP